MMHVAQTAAPKEFVTSSLIEINFNKSSVIGSFVLHDLLNGF